MLVQLSVAKVGPALSQFGRGCERLACRQNLSQQDDAASLKLGHCPAHRISRARGSWMQHHEIESRALRRFMAMHRSCRKMEQSWLAQAVIFLPDYVV